MKKKILTILGIIIAILVFVLAINTARKYYKTSVTQTLEKSEDHYMRKSMEASSLLYRNSMGLLHDNMVFDEYYRIRLADYVLITESYYEKQYDFGDEKYIDSVRCIRLKEVKARVSTYATRDSIAEIEGEKAENEAENEFENMKKRMNKTDCK